MLAEDKSQKLWGLVDEALGIINKEYPENDSFIHCQFFSQEEIDKIFPEHKGKAGFAILPPQQSKIKLPGIPEDADGLALFNRDLLASYEEDLKKYTILHELLHCALSDERNEIIHPLTLKLLEKYLGRNPKKFMAKYHHLYSEEKINKSRKLFYNMNEKELLDKLVESGQLGEGKAEFEVNVSENLHPKYVDMIYETENEIWLIEAKDKLNYEAIGQILTYQQSYSNKYNPNKKIKLGIVCNKSKENLERTCKEEGIKVFLLEKEEKSYVEGGICGVCGEKLVEKEGEVICERCEKMFGVATKPIQCERCGRAYSSIDWLGRLIPIVGLTSQVDFGRYFGRNLCPFCRKFAMEREIKYLFSERISVNSKKDLEEKKVSNLKKIFENHSQEISSETPEIKDISDKEWELIDGEKKYFIEEYNDRLNIWKRETIGSNLLRLALAGEKDYITLCDVIKEELKSGRSSREDLENPPHSYRGIPRELVDYALKKRST